MNIRIRGAVLGFALALTTPVFADDVAPAVPGAEAAAHDVWVADFDAAVAKAKAEKKDLLVDFTGSDWCGWCIKLHGEVFEKDDFLAAAKKDYILVALDYPRDEAVKAKVPNPARNAELAKQYKIQGYPTVLLMTADGEVFGRTGYQAGGSEKYVEHIAKLRADGVPALQSAKALLAEIAAASDADKPAARVKAIDALEKAAPGSVAAPLLADPVTAAFMADADNKAGIRARAAKALLASGTADASVMEGVTTLDPKNEMGLLEHAVMAKAGNARSPEQAKAVFAEIEALFAGAGVKDAKVKKQLAVMGMSLANHPQVMNDKAKAKEFALRVKECGFDEGEDRLKGFVEKLLGEEAPK